MKVNYYFCFQNASNNYFKIESMSIFVLFVTGFFAVATLLTGLAGLLFKKNVSSLRISIEKLKNDVKNT